MLKVANATTEMELMGIKIAATTGDKLPVKAKAIPTMLYMIEMTKLNFTMVSDFRA